MVIDDYIKKTQLLNMGQKIKYYYLAYICKYCYV